MVEHPLGKGKVKGSIPFLSSGGSMGVALMPHRISDSLTPVCNDCGVALCYDIGMDEYISNQEFWDNWRCDACDPEVHGSYLRYRASKLSERSPNGMAPGSEPGPV